MCRGQCHGFVILLLVFCIITACTALVIKGLILQFLWLDNIPATCFSKEKKNCISQRTSQSEKEDTAWKSRDQALSALSLSGSHAEGWVCFQAMRPHSSRPFSFGNFLSLVLFDLLPSITIRWYYIVLSCIPISWPAK